MPALYDGSAAAKSGLLAGLISGAVLSVTLLLQGILEGHGPWTGLRTVAATFLGEGVKGSTFALKPILVGSVAHFGLSLAFGLAFGLVAYRLSRATVLWASVVWGLLVYSFMVFLALPVANPELVPAEISFLAAMQHLLFGGVIGLAFEPLRFRVTAARRQVLPAQHFPTPRPV